MAGIDFRELRAAITMRDVVELIDFVPTVVRGDQLPLYEAAEQLCRQLGLAVPRLVREQRRGTRTGLPTAAE